MLAFHVTNYIMAHDNELMAHIYMLFLQRLSETISIYLWVSLGIVVKCRIQRYILCMTQIVKSLGCPERSQVGGQIALIIEHYKGFDGS